MNTKLHIELVKKLGIYASLYVILGLLVYIIIKKYSFVSQTIAITNGRQCVWPNLQVTAKKCIFIHYLILFLILFSSVDIRFLNL